MNCPDVRAALPEFVYGSLPPASRTGVQAHLEACPECRREEAALRHVRGLLDAAPGPSARVDVAAVYREAAERQKLRLRRWRRVALVAGAAAAVLLTLTAVVRLEVRLQPDQLVVRWGAAPTPPPALPAPPPVLPAPSAPPTPAPPAVEPRELAALEERVRTLSDLVQALADDGRDRDYQRGQQLDRLRRQVAQWQGVSDQRYDDMEKDFSALYIAQFHDHKGVQP